MSLTMPLQRLAEGGLGYLSGVVRATLLCLETYKRDSAAPAVNLMVPRRHSALFIDWLCPIKGIEIQYQTDVRTAHATCTQIA